jgi:hypothetical protein
MNIASVYNRSNQKKKRMVLGIAARTARVRVTPGSVTQRAGHCCPGLALLGSVPQLVVTRAVSRHTMDRLNCQSLCECGRSRRPSLMVSARTRGFLVC